jgi:hypothetical protein
MKTGVMALAVGVAVLAATACSTGTWVDLAAFGAPRNCKDLDGKTHGMERVGAEILLGSSDVKETLAFFARDLLERGQSVDDRLPVLGHRGPSQVQVAPPPVSACGTCRLR